MPDIAFPTPQGFVAVGIFGFGFFQQFGRIGFVDLSLVLKQENF